MDLFKLMQSNIYKKNTIYKQTLTLHIVTTLTIKKFRCSVFKFYCVCILLNFYYDILYDFKFLVYHPLISVTNRFLFSLVEILKLVKSISLFLKSS